MNTTLSAGAGWRVTDAVELNLLLGGALRKLGRHDEAGLRLDAALALDAAHRDAALAKAQLCLELGDAAAAEAPEWALATYREGLAARPDDHRLLLRCLDLLVPRRAWAESVEVLGRLVATEKDPGVRARYRRVAATLLADELHLTAEAVALLAAALQDDPTLAPAAADLERLLAAAGDWDALETHLRVGLQRLGPADAADGRDAERLRLWAALAELYLDAGRRDEALTALEVAVHLEPDNLPRRRKLADLYSDQAGQAGAAVAGADLIDKAILEHRGLLAVDPGRLASYRALERLFRAAGRTGEAEACTRATHFLAAHGLVDGLVGPVAAAPPRPTVAAARDALTPELCELADALAGIEADAVLHDRL